MVTLDFSMLQIFATENLGICPVLTGLCPFASIASWVAEASMIKAQLIERIFAQNSHLRRRDAENVINAILDEIIAALARGDRVEIRGFGAFTVRRRRARIGLNPQNQTAVAVEEKGARSLGAEGKFTGD
jgi:integration host factor subunit beta